MVKIRCRKIYVHYPFDKDLWVIDCPEKYWKDQLGRFYTFQEAAANFKMVHEMVNR